MIRRLTTWFLCAQSVGLATFLACGPGAKFSGGGGKSGTESTTNAPQGAGSSASGSTESTAESHKSEATTTMVFKLGGSYDLMLMNQGIKSSTPDDVLEQKNQASGFLDILVVIDNSASMAEEQKSLSTKLSSLISDPRIQSSDWQIGVVTTDPGDASFNDASTKCLRALIKKGDADIEAKFKTAIEAGINGNNEERGILTAVLGLKSECLVGQSWLRDNSTIGVVIVSDEDNCSNGDDASCIGKADRSSQYLTSYLSKIRKLGEEARIYGIIWEPGVKSTQCNTGFNIGNTYSEAVKASKGKTGSICDADYSAILETMSKDISTIIRNQFTLKIAPPPGTYSVYVDEVLQTSGFTVVGKTLTFLTPPALGSKIRVAYDRKKLPFVTSAQLSPDALAVKQVFIDGKDVDSTLWTFDPTKHELTFLSVPDEGANIRIAFQKSGNSVDSLVYLPGPINWDSVLASALGKSLDWTSPDRDACAAGGMCALLIKDTKSLPPETDVKVMFSPK